MEKQGFVYILASRREKAIKKWYRKWKLELIESHNPDWRDLWDCISGSPLSRGWQFI